MSDIDQFFRESRMSNFPTASFESVGDRARGRIVNAPRVINNAFGKALVVDLANDQVSEGGRTVFIKAGQMAAAVGDACGDKGLAEGGLLDIVLTELRDTGKGNPLKVYEAAYDAPIAKVDVASIFDQQ